MRQDRCDLHHPNAATSTGRLRKRKGQQHQFLAGQRPAANPSDVAVAHPSTQSMLSTEVEELTRSSDKLLDRHG